MEQRKYADILRMGHRETVGAVKEGDYITVYEKLDGANASLEEPAEVLAFSRNTRLSPENNLRGFYEWTRQIDPSRLLPNVIYYGEWLVNIKSIMGRTQTGSICSISTTRSRIRTRPPTLSSRRLPVWA